MPFQHPNLWKEVIYNNNLITRVLTYISCDQILTVRWNESTNQLPTNTMLDEHLHGLWVQSPVPTNYFFLRYYCEGFALVLLHLLRNHHQQSRIHPYYYHQRHNLVLSLASLTVTVRKIDIEVNKEINGGGEGKNEIERNLP